MEATNEIREKLKRPAIILRSEDGDPPDNPLASSFGRVNVCAPGETWPATNGSPMIALCQINLVNLPFRPARLADIGFLTLFIDPTEFPSNDSNGQHWCLRTYSSSSNLVPLPCPDMKSALKALRLQPQVLEEDFPCRDDIPFDLPPSLEDNYEELFPNASGLKLGGWPSLIQSEIYWSPLNQHPAAPEFVFQVDSEPKANWNWGDGGVGYFGRGTTEGRQSEWACEWQCY